VPERRRTAFADILRKPDPVVEDLGMGEIKEVSADTSALLPKAVVSNPPSAKRNKATSPEYTKLTAYIPRRLAAAIKMSMALDQTADQSEYIEHALTDWLQSKGRETVLLQAGSAKRLTGTSDTP